MSDNIPIEVQMEIIKWLPVKQLIQFRSVSKTWKSLIDSSEFIACYSRQHTDMQHLLLRYDDLANYEKRHVSVVDDDSFPQHRVLLTPPPLVETLKASRMIGFSRGLLCLYGAYERGRDGPISGTGKVVIWNPSIRKAVDAAVPNVADGKIYDTVLGFGVCRQTNVPKVVKITHIVRREDMENIASIPCQVEVFTLSTGDWRSLYNKLPRKSIRLRYHPEANCCPADINGVLYWFAIDRITMDGEHRSYNLIISFDITTEEFGEVNLPIGLRQHNPVEQYFSVFNLRESLIVLEGVIGANRYDVWMMEGDVPKSFTRMFTFNVITPYDTLVMGFRKNGEPIIEIVEAYRGQLVVYVPESKQRNNLGIDGFRYTIFMQPYMETLMLLDQPTAES